MKLPISPKMQSLLTLMPDDEPVLQVEVYDTLVEAEGIGCIPYAMDKRGLIEAAQASPRRGAKEDNDPQTV